MAITDERVSADERVAADEPGDSRKSNRHSASAHLLLDQAQKLSVSLFFREPDPVRMLGITSPIHGEGKSVLAMALGHVLAHDSSRPVVLIECNWEHPTLHQHFRVPSAPGLAEWLSGERDRTDIRHQVYPNLHLITAGEGRTEATMLLHRARRGTGVGALLDPDELAIVELPSVLAAPYCTIAACLVDTSVMVVRAGVTPHSMVSSACLQLQHVPIEGFVLNAVHSHIPQWLQQVM